MKSIEFKKGFFVPRLVSDVGSALIQGVLTNVGERVMRPNLGTNLSASVFEDEAVIRSNIRFMVEDLVRLANLNCKIIDVYVRRVGDILYVDILYEFMGVVRNVGFSL